jgi:hypothetical protein
MSGTNRLGVALSAPSTRCFAGATSTWSVAELDTCRVRVHKPCAGERESGLVVSSVIDGVARAMARIGALEGGVMGVNPSIAAASRMHAELLGRTTALHVFSDLLSFRRRATGWLAQQKTALEPTRS